MENNENKTLEQVRHDLRNSLTPKYGEREATAMSRAILMQLKGWNLTELLANEEREASDYIRNRSKEILEQLLKGVPLQYALGETTFYGLTIHVAPGVLIPRPETEEMVDLIVKENCRSDLKVADLCTGSGAIAIALARNLPFAEVDGVDISGKAIQIAKENAENLKVNVKFQEKDVFTLSLPDDEYDIIVSNPPYVDESEKTSMEQNVLEYEPPEALFVTDDNPLVFYKRIADIGLDALAEGGRLYFEINPRHSEELRRLLEKKGYVDVQILKDVHGSDRFATAKKSR